MEAFLTTRWTMVFKAADLGASAAREEFARCYWFPLYAYARRRSADPSAAADAVQELLSRVLTGSALADLSPAGGRLRDFLRSALDHQLTDQFRTSHAAKRRPPGGFVFPDGLAPEARLALEPVDNRSPERTFDRLCARSLLDASADRLQREFGDAGRTELFTHLFNCLANDPTRETHADAARRLGLDEGTLRNKVTAFRARFAKVFRQQVAATLDDPGRVDDEIRDLLAALAGP